MSADCLSFSKKDNYYEIINDDLFLRIDNRKKAINKLLNILGEKVEKNEKLQSINWKELKTFYYNYSTQYINWTKKQIQTLIFVYFTPIHKKSQIFILIKSFYLQI